MTGAVTGTLRLVIPNFNTLLVDALQELITRNRSRQATEGFTMSVQPGQPSRDGDGARRTPLIRLLPGFFASSATTAWGVVIGAAVTAALAAWIVPAIFGSSQSVEEQIAALRHAATREGLYPVLGREVDLGSGDPSYVMVLRAQSTAQSPATASVSDVIRVYDIHEKRLRRAYEYQPLAFNDGFERFGFPYLYKVQEITDVDGNGRPEIIGSFSVQSGTGLHTPIPTVLSWDELTQQFVLAPLLAHKPHIVAVPHPGIAQGDSRAGVPLTLTSRDRPVQLQGYPVETYGVLHREHESPLVIGGFLVRARDNADPQLYQAVAWTLNLTLQTPDTYECPAAPVYVRLTTRESLSQQLVYAWVKQRGRGYCE
jgi:hypothetical protein